MDDTLPQLRPPSASGLTHGATLGRYVILERIGAGGMGVVYAAYDPELDRRVALKLLHPGQDEPSLRARLLQEAQAMARLAHPNVVTVHDAGAVGEHVFVAMDFVDGMTLKAWIAERPRSWREVLATLVPAVRGLAAAHAAGLVHRDFKPDNVMLARDGRVLVMDFGLARTSGAAPEPSVTPPSGRRPPVSVDTQTGAVLGTPAYMAPEQHLGHVADALADQFAFCVSLHEALHGARPVELGAAAAAVAMAGPTRTATPGGAKGTEVRAGRVGPGPRDAELPVRLRRALARGLTRDPGARWPSMTALLDELEAIARPRRWAAVVIGGVGLAIAAAGLTFALMRGGAAAAPSPCLGAAARLDGVWDPAARTRLAQAFRATGSPVADASVAAATRALDAYFAAWVRQRTDACVATQRGEQSAELLDLRMSCLDGRFAEASALVEIFGRADAEVVIRAVAAASGLSPLAACADATALTAPVPVPQDPAGRAAVDSVRAGLAKVRAQRAAGAWPEAMVAARTVTELAVGLKHDPLLAEALYEQADLESKVGELAASESDFVLAAAAADRGRHDHVRAGAYLALIYVTGALGRRPSDGHRYARLAEPVIVRLGDPLELRAALLKEEGAVYATHEPARALPMLAEALRLRERAFGADDPGTAMARFALGNAHYENGDYAAARTELLRARTQLERVLGAGHPRVASVLVNLGNIAAQEHELDEAQRFYEEALGLRERVLGPDSAELGTLVHNLGYVLQTRGQWQEALVMERRALVLLEKKFGAVNPVLGSPLTGIGEALLALGDPAGAIAPLDRALALRSAEGGTVSDRARTSFHLARALWDGGGDRGRARTLATQAEVGWTEAKETDGAADAAAWLAAHRR